MLLDEIGFYCGRFQHMHLGHESVVRRGLCFVHKIYIMIGSAQESGTYRNPYSYEIRKRIIEKTFAKEVAEDRIEVCALNDLSKDPENPVNINPDWGKYVLENIKKCTGGRLPDIMLYGNDEARSRWFDKEDIKDVGELIAPRSKIQISATKMREYLINDDFENWSKYANPAIHDEFNNLRNELLK